MPPLQARKISVDFLDELGPSIQGIQTRMSGCVRDGDRSRHKHHHPGFPRDWIGRSVKTYDSLRTRVFPFRSSDLQDWNVKLGNNPGEYINLAAHPLHSDIRPSFITFIPWRTPKEYFVSTAQQIQVQSELKTGT